MFYDQITDFIFQEDKPQKCEFIFIPGSGYGELAVRAAQLYQKGFADKIIHRKAIGTGNSQQKAIS